MSDELVFTLRVESDDDIDAIEAVVRSAFLGQPFSQQNEHDILRALREAGALSLSLVAVLAGKVVGHVAFSPVSIGAAAGAWFGLGPVSVAPDCQRRGIGAALVRSGLRRLSEQGAAGCVVLGDPAYHGRFGFQRRPGLQMAGLPSDHFMALALAGSGPMRRAPVGEVVGDVRYHAAFGV